MASEIGGWSLYWFFKEEFDNFQEVDRLRYEVERNTFKNFQEQSPTGAKIVNYRLIQDDEVPSWIT